MKKIMLRRKKEINNTPFRRFCYKFFKFTAAGMSALVLMLGVVSAMEWQNLPSSFTVTSQAKLQMETSGFSVSEKQPSEAAAVSAKAGAGQGFAQIKMLGMIPIKTVPVQKSAQPYVTPCGTPFGIKMETNGVIIVGVADIQSDGCAINPAVKAGVRVGDVIRKINGKPVNQNDALASVFEQSGGNPVELDVQRGSEHFKTKLTPVISDADGLYKGGLWVRDSTAGIGTVTFYNNKNGTFGGLGHGICDVDTNELMPLGSGEILNVTISGLVRGQKGNAGELQGYFTNDHSVGSLKINGQTGVYGFLDKCPVVCKSMALAMKQQVHSGNAQILTTICGDKPELYDAVIESVNYNEDRKTKNLVIRVTDKRLLETSGGIIQGMSGSPIIQDGRLAGAVTHVFVNDPTRGYGIFAETMWQTCGNVEKKEIKEAS